ncbi:hypothetical protein [Streptomyces sp. NPDC101393]|uniref:hypothetical protein n=1 Tax=Streptomyces sp. NPDC101393 TaxID=3366141 RepID=UPI00382DC45C
MLTRTTSRLASAGIATIAGLAVLAPAAHALDSAAAGKQPAKLTVAGYTKYLKAKQTPEARKTLKKFNALPKAKKSRFVRYLQDRDVYRALIDTTKGRIGGPLHIVDPYNKDVRFVTDVTSHAAKDKGRTTSVRFTVTEQIYRIPVTSETIRLRYQAKKPGKKVAATAKLTNVNAALSIKHGRVTAKGGPATARTTWHASPRVASFGKKVVKTQSVASAAGTWKAQLGNR